MRYSEDALEEGRKSGDVDLMVPVAHGLCLSYGGSGQFDRLVAMVPGVLDLIEKKEREYDFFGLPVNAYVVLSGHCGGAMGSLGNFHEGELFLEKGLRHATRIGDLRTLAFIEFTYGFFRGVKGDWKVAAEHAQKTITYSEEVKFLITLSGGWCVLGNAYAHLGDPETGKSYGEKGLKMHQDAGIEWALSAQYFYLGDTHLQLGDLEHARSLRGGGPEVVSEE